MDSITEVTGNYHGFQYAVRFHEDGHRCGYVKVSNNTFNQINDSSIYCHGGITFSEYFSKENPFNFSEGYQIGFDCIHAGDGLDFDEALKIFPSKENSINTYKNLCKSFSTGHIWTKAEVENECKSIIHQIEKMN